MTSPKPPRPPGTAPHLPGDDLPLPRVIERSPESGWAEFEALQAGAEFAPTQPTTLPGGLPPGAAAPAVPAAPAGVPVEDTLRLARLRNRVCPLPPAWERMYRLLLAAAQSTGVQAPPPPLGAAEWAATAALAKRMFLRDHIEWAAAHGALAQVHAFLEQLPEEHWQHMAG